MAAGTSLSLDISLLYLIAGVMGVMLGVLMFVLHRREEMQALAWWGGAYLLGGSAIATWSVVGTALPPAFILALQAAGFVACGMVWTAARSFHGRSVTWIPMIGGAAIWAAAQAAPFFADAGLQTILGGAIVAVYAGLTGGELARERRQSLRSRWPAIVVPLLHGSVLMLPLLVGRVIGGPGAGLDLRNVWGAIFAVELALYAVGTVFVIFFLVSERAVRTHKNAAAIDPMTGLLNRRGFAEASVRMVERAAATGRPVSVLMFDIDHFKSVNDRYGHLAGDEVLKLFANILAKNVRVTDLVARVGGEEFSAALPCSAQEALLAAERVRESFATLGVEIDNAPLATTVSIGVAGGAPGTPIDLMIASADAALYRAKRGGRNRVELSPDVPLTLEQTRRRAAASASASASGEGRIPVVTTARGMSAARA